MKEILITDDNISTCNLIRNYLANTSYSVLDPAYSCKNAIEKIKIKKPDLVLLNKNLNDDGKHLYSLVLAKLAIPVVLIDYRQPNNKNDSLLTDHLYHPFTKEDLIHILDYNLGNNEKIKHLYQDKKQTHADDIINECGLDAYNFIREYVDLLNKKSIVISTTFFFNLKFFLQGEYNALVNFKRVNDIRYLNKFFITANELLPVGGTFIGCAETKALRKKRILKKYPPVLNYIYYSLDFILKRVFPKLPITKNIYFWLTNGRNRVLSQPEILGRLYSCGFEITKEQFIGNLYYFVTRKIKDPLYNVNSSYGPLIKMRRIGKNGKMIKAYKFRTMHPYSEYIQEYIYNKNKLGVGGKFKNDFRITTIGRIMRKFWIDEFPMIYNVIKGDLKIFGIRPLSEQYFSLYPEDFRKIRIKYKPGLIPPFYRDLPKTFEEIIESEKRYLLLFDKHPFKTDLTYFLHAVYNIIFKRVRSN